MAKKELHATILRGIEKISATDRLLLPFLLAFRILNAFLLMTLFEPDEVFQNVEPVSFVLSGKSAPTWDWMLGIRSVNFVVLYLAPSLVPHVLKSMSLAYAVPKIVNGIIAGLTDYFTVKLARFYAVDALATTLLSYGLWLYLPRSHINSFEALLGVSAFYFIEKFRRENSEGAKTVRVQSLRTFLLIAVYGTFLRPSLLALIAFPALKHIVFGRNILRALVHVPEAAALLSLLVMNDTIFYRELIFVPYNFVRVNILCGVSDLFGTQPWYSHCFFAVVLMGNVLPFFLLRARKFRLISLAVLSFFLFYSSVGHKEMRFLVPIVPLCNIVASRRMGRLVFCGNVIGVFIAAYIGIFFRNTTSTIFALQGEIRKFDQENGKKGEIRVFYCVAPYVIPTHPFFPHPRVTIRELGENPNVFSKIPNPKIYKRFENQRLIVKETRKFRRNMKKRATELLDYDFVLIHGSWYEEVQEMLENHFAVVKRLRYFPWYMEEDPHAFIYVLRRRKRRRWKIQRLLTLEKVEPIDGGAGKAEIGGGETRQGGSETPPSDRGDALPEDQVQEEASGVCGHNPLASAS